MLVSFSLVFVANIFFFFGYSFVAPLKVVNATFLPFCFVYLKENACETGKNIFYFTSKAFFVLEIIKF